MAGPGTPQPYIKILWFLKRKEGMSPEDFHKYWEEDHARFALNIPGFKQIAKRYSQFHPAPEFQAKADALGMQTLDFDGVAELWVESVEGYAKHMGQAELAEASKREGAEFMGPGSKVLIGYETLVHGEPVPGIPKEKSYTL
ncbi:EthD domain-containing protein [Aspergillus ambiguus]|uniref:EthD domain-containing protein n=1 Tax=Aspergillus ambiguus TaxID=176160 RepID=UPI003CCE2826